MVKVEFASLDFNSWIKVIGSPWLAAVVLVLVLRKLDADLCPAPLLVSLLALPNPSTPPPPPPAEEGPTLKGCLIGIHCFLRVSALCQSLRVGIVEMTHISIISAC